MPQAVPLHTAAPLGSVGQPLQEVVPQELTLTLLTQAPLQR